MEYGSLLKTKPPRQPNITKRGRRRQGGCIACGHEDGQNRNDSF